MEIKKRGYLIGILILVTVLIPIVQLNEVISQQSDDWAYNGNTSTYTIFAGQSSNERINLTLLSPHNNSVIVGKDRQVAEIQIHTFLGGASPFFQQMDFYDERSNGHQTEKDFTFKWESITGINNVTDIIRVCNPFEDENNNSFINNNCTLVEDGSHLENITEWVVFDHAGGLPEPNPIKIGIFVDVILDEKIEWIPTLFGVELNEWATWIEGFNTDLVIYHDMNGTEDIRFGDFNLTLEGTPGFNRTGALIGNSSFTRELNFLN